MTWAHHAIISGRNRFGFNGSSVGVNIYWVTGDGVLSGSSDSVYGWTFI